MQLLRVSLLLSLLCSSLLAATIRVPQDQSTIQAGIDAAVNGDTVLVGPGVWSGGLVVASKSLTLAAEDTLYQVVITPNGPSSRCILVEACDSVQVEGFYFSSEMEESVDPNLEVANQSKCLFRRCAIRSIGASNMIRSDSTSVLVLRQCLLKGTSAAECAVIALGNHCEIVNCTFLGGYDGISASGDSVLLINNAILNFTHAAVTGLSAKSQVDYNLFWNNTINYQDRGEGTHDLVADPLFDCLNLIDQLCELPAYPTIWSPCKDAGSSLQEFQDPDGTRNDIGAFFRPSHIFIPDDAKSLAEAVIIAIDGDSIVYRSGIHAESSEVETWDLRDLWIIGENGDERSILEPAVTNHSILKLSPHVSFNEEDPTASEWHLSNLSFRNSVGASALAIECNFLQGFGVSNCRFEDNSADSGAAVFLIADQGASSNITGNEFVHNLGGYGSALLVDLNRAGWGDDAVNIGQNSFRENSGTSILESSVMGVGGRLTASFNVFEANSAQLYISNGGSEWATWSQNQWVRNTVTSGGFIHYSQHARTENTISGNSFIANRFLNESGVCLQARGRHLNLERNLVALTENGSGIEIPDTTNGYEIITVTCNNSWGNGLDDYLYAHLDSTNRSLDPLFCDTATSDYSIRDISPCAPANNTCGVLIGAYGVGCENAAPQITSPAQVNAVRETPFVYHATSTDPDGPSILYSFESLPSWLSNHADSVFGVPGLEDSDTSFTLIVTDGFLADTQVVEITVSGPPYAGPVWHIATTGNDSLGDGSEALPFKTIQRGINAASNGDTVLVADGHYYERITYLGKKIIVASKYLIDSDTSHIAQTIIDGDTSFVPMIADTGCVVRFVNGEDSTSTLTGFTIRNGIGVGRLGSGVMSIWSSPTIVKCRAMKNMSAGIWCHSGGGRIFDCDISQNYSNGVYFGSSGRIDVQNCTISHNDGTGVNATWWLGRIYNCTVQNNSIGMGITSGFTPTADDSEDQGSESRSCREVRNVTFRENAIGVYVLTANWCFDSCVFVGNTTCGMVTVEDGSPVVSNSVFRSNGNSSGLGGAVRHTNCECSSSFQNTLFEGNIAAQGGAFAIEGSSRYGRSIVNCTFVDNTAQQGSEIYLGGSARLSLENCLIAYNRVGSAILHSSGLLRTPFTCSNIYGNEGGDWVDSLSTLLGVDGNISADPLFCDTASGNYTIRDSSPCAPANNSCGTLIGAYGIGCANAAPALTSSETVDAYSGLPFSYQPTATDIDGPLLSFTFQNLPSWLSANSDSVFGTPPLTDVDSSLLVIVTDGFLADSQIVTIELTETPLLSGPRVEGDSLALHVVSHTPLISWRYYDLIGGYPQTHYEIAVGSDSNWSHAELWNPAPFSGDDSAIAYTGAALTDGQSYWVRVRAKNALIWSNWKQTKFHLNSLPTVPTPLSPIGDIAVGSTQPTFVIRNSSDAENDSLRYIFEISSDSTLTGAHVFEKAADADSITSAQIDIALDENARYFWRVRASDYYELSAFSSIGSFFVNATNSAPSIFDLTDPPNTTSPPLVTKFPTLAWTPATDADPLDQVKYALHLATDAAFTFVHQIPDLDSSSYVPTVALERGRHYWWKVRANDLHDGETWSASVSRFRIMTLGDANSSDAVSISDAVFLIGYIFGGGPAPNPLIAGDCNCNGSISISDVVCLINYIFGGGPAPCERPEWR